MCEAEMQRMKSEVMIQQALGVFSVGMGIWGRMQFFHEKANANFLQIGQKWKQIAAYVHIWAFRHSRVSAEPQDSLVWLRCSTP